MNIRFPYLAAGILFGVVLVLATSCRTRTPADPSRPSPDRERVEIDTRRVTWASVDVTPDGETLIFDLLGDLYALPVDGGSARRLTTAAMDVSAPSISSELRLPASEAFDVQPRVSPNGRRIVFISDRNGTDNLWVINRDGSGAVRISNENGVALNSPAWAPDGDHIVVRRSGSLRTGELWRYPVEPDQIPSSGHPLTDVDELIDAQGPVFGPDGQHLYFAAPFGVEPPRQLRRETWQIGRLKLATGDIKKVTDRENGAVRPRLAPDGTLLAYATWNEKKPSLVLRNLDTDEERVLTRNVERNLQDMYLTHLDLFPGYAFGPAGRFLYLSHGGRLRRVSVDDGRQETIPHHVTTPLDVPRRPEVPSRIGQPRTSRMLRWPDVHPGSGRAVFEAAGRIWTAAFDDPGEEARPLTGRDLYALQPALSPDGSTVAFIASPEPGAPQHLYRMPVTGGVPEQLTETGGRYARPAWAPDGNHLYLLRATSKRYQLMRRSLPEQELVRIAADGRVLQTITTTTISDAGMTVSEDGNRLRFTQKHQLISIRNDGSDRHTGVKAPGARRIVPSPDGAHAAVVCDNRLVIKSLEDQSSTLTCCKQNESYADSPGRHGYFPTWTGPRTLVWSFAGDLFRMTIDRDPSVKRRSKQRLDLEVNLTNPARSSTRDLALTGARILPMTEKGTIENGTIYIRGNRIRKVGPAGEVPIPDAATVKDLSGKTIIPGLIDVHQHALALLSADPVQNLPRPFTPASVLLAYGVTTTRDPALMSNVRDVSMIELINSGRVKGPRYTTTGERIKPSDYPISSMADAREAIRLQKQLGAHYIKSYLQPTRRQRMIVADAARRAGIAVTLEGGFDYRTVVTGLLDGHTGTEHSAGNHPVYADVAELVADTGTYYTPTILSQIGAEFYFRETNLLENRKLQRFYPAPLLKKLSGRTRRGHGLPVAETAFPALTNNVARLVRNGAVVGVGAHDRPAPTGLGTHWEIWSFVRGGLSAKEALKAATREGARILGAGDETGTLEPGKLADLLILNKNPLQSIRHTRSIDRVIKNGRIFDGDTLEQTWP